MRSQGLRGASRAKKHFTTKSDAAHVRAPDLVKRDFTAPGPDALWVADFTYCSTWSGIVYVAFIIDVYSRRLVGWKAARSMTAPLVIDALNMAAWTRRHSTLDGLVCHTDAGSQYTSIAYTDRLGDVGAAPSIGTVNPMTTQWRNRSWAYSRPSSTGTQLPWRPTAVRGKGSTTWRPLPAPGFPGSTRSGSTPSSTTGHRQNLRAITTSSTRSPVLRERANTRTLPPLRSELCRRPSPSSGPATSRRCDTTSHQRSLTYLLSTHVDTRVTVH